MPRTIASGLDVAGMRAVLADTGLRVTEIEFLGGWALDTDPAEVEAPGRRSGFAGSDGCLVEGQHGRGQPQGLGVEPVVDPGPAPLAGDQSGFP